MHHVWDTVWGMGYGIWDMGYWDMGYWDMGIWG